MNDNNGKASTGGANDTAKTMSTSTNASKDEIALYDRQIRLWGFQSQQRIRNASVFMVGIETPIAHEILKNLCLTGIGKITLLEVNEPLKKSHLLPTSPFFFNENDMNQKMGEVIKRKLTRLNPSVNIHILEVEEFYFSHLKERLHSFDLVVLAQGSIFDIIYWNRLCRLSSVKFYYSGIHSDIGFNYCDYLCHSYIESLFDPSTEGKQESTSEPIRKEETINFIDFEFFNNLMKENYVNLEILKKKMKKRKFDIINQCIIFWCYLYQSSKRFPSYRWLNEIEYESSLMSFMSNGKESIPPVDQQLEEDSKIQELINKEIIGKQLTPALVSIIGGHASQDIIRGVSGNGKPLTNILLFSASQGSSVVYDFTKPIEVI